MTSSQDWKSAATNYFRNRGKIQNLFALAEAENWQAMHEEQRKNQAAESAAVRKAAFGSDEQDAASEGEEMRQTILGDVTNPTPIVVAPGGGDSFGKTLLPLALGASLMGVPAAGVIGAFLANRQGQPQQTEVVQQPPQESMSIGLGKIEDLLRDK